MARATALPPPFMTLATQNPIEHEGTYPLPEAQLDRFLMKILIDYPGDGDEREIVRRASSGGDMLGGGAARGGGDARAGRGGAAADRWRCRWMPSVIAYAVALVAGDPRVAGAGAGCGHARGDQPGADRRRRSRCWTGRDFVIPDDVKAAALPVLRHRVQLTPEVTISGQGVDEILQTVVESVAAPRA